MYISFTTQSRSDSDRCLNIHLYGAVLTGIIEAEAELLVAPRLVSVADGELLVALREPVSVTDAEVPVAMRIGSVADTELLVAVRELVSVADAVLPVAVRELVFVMEELEVAV